jgi:hypothetical protein
VPLTDIFCGSSFYLAAVNKTRCGKCRRYGSTKRIETRVRKLEREPAVDTRFLRVSHNKQFQVKGRQTLIHRNARSGD